MAKAISVKEATMLRKLSERCITELCKDGSIHDAAKKRENREITDNSERPTDSRIKTSAYARMNCLKHLSLPIGVSDYRPACTEYCYIDKTMMLKNLIDEHPMFTFFTRLSRFRKTLNMDMIRTFFEKE